MAREAPITSKTTSSNPDGADRLFRPLISGMSPMELIAAAPPHEEAKDHDRYIGAPGLRAEAVHRRSDVAVLAEP